jgi:hypothetical protein
VTQRRGAKGAPRDFLASGTWPDGKLKKDAPVAVRYAQAVTVNLRSALNGRSISSVAEAVDIARSTLHDLVSGRTWPDFQTLVKLEQYLEARLWPDAHA